jgi:hypothetical protein
LLQDVSVPAAGSYTLVFEYSTGESWAACLDLVDNTDRFQSYGLNVIAHTPQADWARSTLLGKNLYWLRVRAFDGGLDYLPPRAGYARVSKDSC